MCRVCISDSVRVCQPAHQCSRHINLETYCSVFSTSRLLTHSLTHSDKFFNNLRCCSSSHSDFLHTLFTSLSSCIFVHRLHFQALLNVFFVHIITSYFIKSSERCSARHMTTCAVYTRCAKKLDTI